MGRILAVDPGTKRIGLAVSDTNKIISMPLGTIEFKGIKKLIDDLRKIIEEKNITDIIVGYPLKKSGDTGHITDIADKIIDALEKELGIKPIRVDEYYSSKDAEKYLIEGDVSRKKRKKKIDSLAASLILKNHLREINNDY